MAGRRSLSIMGHPFFRPMQRIFLAVVLFSSFGCGGDEAPADLRSAAHLFIDSVQAPCRVPTVAPQLDDTVVLDAERDFPCRLKFHNTGIVLRGDSGGTVPDPGDRVIRDSQGRFVTTVVGNNSALALWNPDGSFASSLFQVGEGPGELPRSNTAPILYHGPKDRLYVRSSAGRWSIFEPTLGFVRRIAVAPNATAQSHNAVMMDGSIVSTGIGPQDGRYFKHTDSLGNLIRSFGEVAPDISPALLSSGSRSVVAGSDTLFWSGPQSNAGLGYFVELWSTGGNRLRTLRRDVFWYPWVNPTFDVASTEDERKRARPAPSLLPKNVDDAGLLLVYAWVPNDRHRWVEDVAERRLLTPTFQDLHLEVIDPSTGSVLASETVSVAAVVAGAVPMSFFPGTRLGYRYDSDSTGVPSVHIVEYSLVGR